MKRGPVGQSVKAAELAGHPGKRPPRKPPPSLGVAPPNMSAPRHLSAMAKQFWRGWYEPLRRGHMLQASDLLAFELLCAAYGRWREAEEKLASDGAWVKTSNGNRGPSPFFRIARQAADEVRAGCNMFGLTPPARARLETDFPSRPPGESNDSELERWETDQQQAGTYAGLIGRDPRK